jgi:hypothetical protein
MDKNINTNKPRYKKIIKIVLLTPLVLIGLFLLYVVVVFASTPIIDKIDHDKFTTLDIQMQGLFKKLETSSNNTDKWKYAAVCNAEKTGWMLTGKYNCVTSISTQKTIASVKEINDLQTKYYPVIDNDAALKQISELDPQLPNDFGKKFVVSSTEKQYKEVKSEIGCDYLIKLYQNNRSLGLSHDSYGSKIGGEIGSAFISFRCSETARDHWYTLSQTADQIIP